MIEPSVALWFTREEDVPWLGAALKAYMPNLPGEAYQGGKNLVLLRLQSKWEKGLSLTTEPLEVAYKLATLDQRPHEFDEVTKWFEYDNALNDQHFIRSSILTLSTPLLEDGTSEQDIYGALQRCIETVSRFERAYLIVSQDYEYQPLTLRSMYPFIPFTIRNLSEGNTARSEIQLLQVNNRSIARTPLIEDLDLQAMEELKSRSGRLAQNDPFHIPLHLNMLSLRSFYADGDNSSSVLNAFTAGEALLNTVLMSVAWDSVESCAPNAPTIETIASWFLPRKSLSSRMNSCYQHFLRGWDMSNQSRPLYQWIGIASKIRNRVIHSGYEPTEDEALAVYDAFTALEEELKRIILDERNRTRYMRTIMMWLGREGLQRRGLYTGKLKTFDIATIVGDRVKEFSVFRALVDKEIQQQLT